MDKFYTHGFRIESRAYKIYQCKGRFFQSTIKLTLIVDFVIGN